MIDTLEAYRVIRERAVEARIPISTLCRNAGVSPSGPVHWNKGSGKPSLTIIGKLEKAIAIWEREQSA